MGDANRKAPVYDKRMDKSLTTVADIEAMKEQVETWTKMVQQHVEGIAMQMRQEFGMCDAAVQRAAHDELTDLRRIVDEYRLDEIRDRQSRTWRGRVRRWLGIAQPSPMPGLHSPPPSNGVALHLGKPTNYKPAEDFGARDK